MNTRRKYFLDPGDDEEDETGEDDELEVEISCL